MLGSQFCAFTNASVATNSATIIVQFLIAFRFRFALGSLIVVGIVAFVAFVVVVVINATTAGPTSRRSAAEFGASSNGSANGTALVACALHIGSPYAAAMRSRLICRTASWSTIGRT